jgi:hypothetical protein
METSCLNTSGFLALSFPTRDVDGRRRHGALVLQNFKLGCLPRFDLRRSGRSQSRLALDRDFARLQCRRDLTHEVDRQETVAQIRSGDPDMVGKLEPVFERTAGNATMQVAIGRYLPVLAGDNQQIGLEGDVEVVLGKTRHRDRDPVGVVTGLDDVIGRPVADRAGTLGIFQKIEDPVEADAGPEQRCVVVRLP